MSDHAQRVRVEEFDLMAALPFLRLFRAFRLAIHLPNLFLALFLVVSLWVLGQTMDGLWGHRVYSTEISQYANLSAQEYTLWIEQAQHRELGSTGIFATAQRFKLNAVHQLIWAMVQFRFVVPSTSISAHGDSVASSLRDLVITLPGWLWTSHRTFLLIYGSIAIGLWAMLGGAITRSTAMLLIQGQSPGLIKSIRFGCVHWRRFILSPILPLLLAAAVCVIPVTYGAIFFNVPVLNMIGGLALIVPLLCGAMITILLILYAAGAHLLYPAIAIEGADSFDAISRAFGYVLTRPWRWLAYNVLMMMYAAVTYFLISIVICLTLWITLHTVGLGVRDTAKAGLEPFVATSLVCQSVPGDMGTSCMPTAFWDKASAGGVAFWINVTSMFLIAYAISFYFSANNLIYLLLRRWADGAEFDDVYIDPDEPDVLKSNPSPESSPFNND